MKNKKYGECAKHPNNSMIDCAECAMEGSEPFDFDKPHKHYPEPDFDKMWLNICDKLDNPLVYFIEHKETKEWIHRSNKRTTKEPLCAMKFEGKDGKAMANLFLFLNQDAGTLKDFIIIEHLFEDSFIPPISTSED